MKTAGAKAGTTAAIPTHARCKRKNSPEFSPRGARPDTIGTQGILSAAIAEANAGPRSTMVIVVAVVAAAIPTVVASIAVITVTAARCRDGAIAIDRITVAIVSRDIALGVNRAPVAVATHVNMARRLTVATVSMMRTGVGFNSGSEQGESADDKGSD